MIQNRNNLLILLLAATLLTVSVLFVEKQKKYNQVLKNLEQRSKELISCRKGDDLATATMRKIMGLQWQLNYGELQRNLTLKDLNNKVVSFDSLLKSKKGKVLILRFSWSTCEDCQVQEMKYIERFVGLTNVLVIVSYRKYRDFVLYMKALKVKLPVFYLEGTDILFKKKENAISQVFAFITDKTFKVSNVHIGNASFPMLSENYYKLAGKELLYHGN